MTRALMTDATKGVSMKRPIKLYLSYVEWPQQDRICWEAAFDTGIDLFDDCGPAAHLADRTRRQLEYGYGKYLALLTARHPELLGCPPGERVNRKIVEEYAKWQPATCGGVTLSIYLYHLWLVLRYICPNKDWSWLLTISKRIAAQAKKKPEKHHQVTTEILYALGIELTDHAMGKPAGSRTRQTTYRDGLLISMTALFPLRRRTLAALRIGKHLVRSGDIARYPSRGHENKTADRLPDFGGVGVIDAHRLLPETNSISHPGCKKARLSLGVDPRSANGRRCHLQHGSAAHP